MPFRPSIRFTLAATFVASFAALLAAGSIGLYVILDRHHRHEFDGRLISTAFAARQMFEMERVQYVDASATTKHIVGELLFSDQSLVAFDSTGELVTWSRRVHGAPVLDDLQPFESEEPVSLQLRLGHFRIVRQPLGEGIDLYVGRDLEQLHDDLADLRWIFVLGLPIILAIGGTIGVWASAIALRPVISLARSAERIGTEIAAGRTDFEHVPPRRPADEVAVLATALNQLIDRLTEALQRERELSDSQRRILADTAHELRTPVTILQSSAEVALAAPRSNDEYRSSLESIAAEAQALGMLVNDLLLLTRRDAQGPLHMPEPLYLDDVVSGCLHRIHALPAADGRQIRIGALEAAPAHADPSLIERAVVALVHNALVHAPESPVELSTGTSQANGWMESWVSVRDWGPGIPPEAHREIFQRFARLDPRSPGTGLGLSIVQLIADTSGGRLELESAPGEGATFTLFVPSSLG
jgi:two-component system OmpR family sensor kinase